MDTNSIDGDQLIDILNPNTPYKKKYLRNVGEHEEGIYIENVDVNGKIIFSENYNVIFTVHFNKVTFKTGVNFGGTIFNKSVIFNDCIFEDTFTIGITVFYIATGGDNKNNPTIFRESLLFKNCEFRKSLFILSGIFNSFYTDNCNFLNNPSAHYISKESIYIQGGLFKDGFAVLGGRVDNDIQINGGQFEKMLFFGRDLKVNAQINIMNGYISKIGTENAQIDKVRINCAYKYYIPDIEIGSGIKRLEIYPYQKSDSKKSLVIKKLTFRSSPDSTMIASGCIIQECIFTNYDSSSSSVMSVYQVIIEKLSFIDFNNFGKITFINLKSRKVNSAILFKNTNLGTVDFISCDLSKYELFIDDCKLINIFYTSTKFSDEVKSKKYKIENVHQLRDTYDQLQTVASKQGDRVSSLKWQHKSLKYYFSSLTESDESWWILLSMKYSNNYRMSSALGLLFTTVLAAILFYFYLLAYTGYSSRHMFTPEQNLILINLSPYYFEFINPTHRADFIGRDAKEPLLASFIDLLGRLIIGFGIYQTIQAFRRFGKGE